MPEFKDARGDVWDLTLTLGAAQRIEQSDFSEIYPGTVSLLAPSQEFFTDALTNTPLVLALVWATIKPQADKQDVTEDDLAERLDGPAIAAAKDGFWSAVADFFPEKRTILSRLFEQFRQIEQRLASGLGTISENLGPELNQAVDRELATLQTELTEQLQRAAKTPGATSG